ncbi:MAG: hypothetical protein ABI193_06380 [Minicystis sp.]
MTSRGALGLVLLAACGARSSLQEGQRGSDGAGGTSLATSSSSTNTGTSSTNTGTSSTSASSSTGPCPPGCFPPTPFELRIKNTLLDGVAVDAEGGLLFHGFYWPKAFLGPSDAQSLSEYAMKLDPTGALIWATPLSSSDSGGTSASGRAIATDGESALVATGYGGIALTKLDAGGHVLWRAEAKATIHIVPRVAAGEGGTTVIAGPLLETIDWGAGPLVEGGSYLVAFTPSGAIAWQRRFADISVVDVGVDSAGNTSLVGVSTAADALGPDFVLPPNNGRFVASLDPSGAPRWVHAWDAGFRPARGMIDAGAFVIAGGLTAPVDIGGSMLAPVGPNDRGLVRYDAEGTLLGAFRIPGALPLDSLDLGARSGALAVVMNVSQPISFGGPTFSPAPTVLAVGRFTQGGALVESYGYAADAWASSAIALDPAGSVVLVVNGETELTPDTGPNTLESAIVKLVP